MRWRICFHPRGTSVFVLVDASPVRRRSAAARADVLEPVERFTPPTFMGLRLPGGLDAMRGRTRSQSAIVRGLQAGSGGLQMAGACFCLRIIRARGKVFGITHVMHCVVPSSLQRQQAQRSYISYKPMMLAWTDEACVCSAWQIHVVICMLGLLFSGSGLSEHVIPCWNRIGGFCRV